MEILEFKSVDFKYQSLQGEVNAITDLSFKIEENQFVSIVGPSGCGKTTVLSLISGLLKPTKGEILFNGKSDSLVEFGYMLQKDCLFSWRTILKNALLGLEVEGALTKENISYVESLLKKYGLYEFRDRYPRELSGGMRQRVALIRTLATRPKLLLLDEPTSALDYQTRLNVCDDMYRIIKEEGITAILVTHDISEAISLSDKILLLSKRPATLKQEYHTNFEAKTPLKRRECLSFPKLFEEIWKELN